MAHLLDASETTLPSMSTLILSPKGVPPEVSNVLVSLCGYGIQ
jgi:hypothetical protein